jgi:ligand-binding SRPBCC domain-containing protein
MNFLMPLIELSTVIKAPIAVVFDLARSIDLHKLSTEGTQEEAIAGVTSGLIGMGESVTWRAKHLGIIQQLTSRITGFEYPRFFRDEMVRGAFEMIRHDHIFAESGDYTIMKDRFEFESPGWVFGVFFNKVFLEGYLRSLLEKRNRMIKEWAESDRWKTILKA